MTRILRWEGSGTKPGTVQWVANTGRPLDDSDVQGLCGLGASSKMDPGGRKRASIGHKGLGFKSVLEITEAPAAYSPEYAFRLGRDRSRPLIESLWAELGRPAPRHVPAMRFPERITETSSRWEGLQREGYQTGFRFPFHDRITAEARHGVADHLLSLPITTVLFLKHLEEIRVIVNQRGRDLSRSWLVERRKFNGSGWDSCTGLAESGLYLVGIVSDDGESGSFLVAHDDEVDITGHRAGLSGPAWDGVDLSEVSIAVRRGADREDPVPDDWRRFYVFLPTQEPSTYPILVNGAFSTDLSRQHVRISAASDDYNSHLIRQAARLFRDRLLPVIRKDGLLEVLALLDRGPRRGGPAADLLHIALCEALADVPLLPSESGEPLALSALVVPPPMLGPDGSRFRDVLHVDAAWDRRRFPASEWCAGDVTAIAADHEALALRATDALRVLAKLCDAHRSKLRPEAEGRFQLDPVLELCTALWERAEPLDRQEIEQHAPTLPLFPINERPDGTVERIAIGDATAFYPPRAARQDLPLRGLQFMAHAVCWGNLQRRERLTVLDDRMKAWTALFDVKEFRFEEVMRAAVLPGLVRNPTDDAVAVREANKDLGAIASICQLAGAVTKPDRPLRLNRLGGDRAMFNLSRLPVPCRSVDGTTTWEPAYKAYFGRDWIGDDSVESLVGALASNGTQLDVIFLAPPQEFLGRLGDMGVADADTEPTAEADDEVSLDDDTDEALETDEHERWLAFLSWIGVNRCLRLIHFHDVDDESTGWTRTKDLARPGGWAFSALGGTWDRYREELFEELSRHPRFTETDPYLYEVHDLDQIVPLLHAAAEDETSAIASATFAHLVRHWPTYGAHTSAEVALVEKGKWPSSRKDPPRATPEELHEVGANLWLSRLRQWAVCPTAQGPRAPSDTWRRSDELDRRFGRSGRNAGAFLPVLMEPEGLAPNNTRSLCDRVGVRGELTPSTFTLKDARSLCERLPLLFRDGVEPGRLRNEIRPIYRQLFELLTGRSDDTTLHGQVAEVPLLADTAEGLRFLPAHEVVYASVPGTRERSGIAGKVPLFVLEAEPGATAPLDALFDVQILEHELDWAPEPGEPALIDDDLDLFRNGLRNLTAPLLARMSAGRPEARERDRRMLAQFVDGVEPVQSLVLRCSIGGRDLGELPPRPYFVKRAQRGSSLQAFLVWNGPAWPPVTEDAAALAMSLADTLEVDMVETFLAFIQADDARRMQLLDLAGASGYLAEVAAELKLPSDEPTDGDDVGSGPTSAEIPDEIAGETAATTPTPAPAAPRIPLRKFDDLLIDGEPVLVTGLAYSAGRERHPAGNNGGSGGHAPGGSRGSGAAAGTDLSELDRLGMAISIAFECRRMARLGLAVAVLPGSEPTGDADAYVVDAHTSALIQSAEAQSPEIKAVFDRLEKMGISRIHPGFDLLTIARGEADRLIELKSSGVDAQVQAMSWNEWKSARSSELRERFWLYLAGNLRADLAHATPFLRAIRDPFGSLLGTTITDVAIRRAVQLRVREFAVAEELLLGLKDANAAH